MELETYFKQYNINYNTDYNRNNYIIKIAHTWKEDKAGLYFIDYIIKPIILYIKNLLNDYKNKLKINISKNITHYIRMAII